MKLARMPDGEPEIFYSLQGEGRNTGKPFVFIRASHCNLHCRWCDTAYTWNWEGTSFAHDAGQKFNRDEQIIDLSIEELVEKLDPYPCQNYLFTGGEPLIQEKSWTKLMKALSGTFEIETNGTLFPQDDFLNQIGQINVSPKLANSGIDREIRRKPDILKRLNETHKADFKFVIGGHEDFEEMLTLRDEASIPNERIFLMPQASSPAELEAHQAFVADLAMSHQLNYSDRLHLRLFGAKRGV